MPQKSILQYFSGGKTSILECNTESTIQTINSPKKLIKRRKIIIESDDESDNNDGDANACGNGLNIFFYSSVGLNGFNHDKPDSNNLKSDITNGFKEVKNNSEDSVPSPVREKRSSELNSKPSISNSELKSEKSDNLQKNTINLKSTNISDVNSYDPSKSDYHPINDSIWKKGESVPYLALAKTFQFIESTSGRIKITDALCNLFRSVGILSPNELTTCIYLCLNRIGPVYEGGELGVGETILLKALGATTGVGLEHLKNIMKQQGDLGSVVESVRSRQKTMFTPKPLTVAFVLSKLKEIALMTGNASQGKKVERIRSLLVACRETEAKYLVRSLSGKLRIGLAEQTVLTALGQAATMTPFHSISVIEGDASGVLDISKGLSAEKWKSRLDSTVENVKKAYCVCPNYDQLVKGLLADGPDGLHMHCSIIPGIPLKPMLAHPTHGVTDVFKRFDESNFTCEYKYDGERAQIHVLESGQAHIYSRNQENNTGKYPDIVNNLMPRVVSNAKFNSDALELLKKCAGDSWTSDSNKELTLKSCIIDSEVVAWDRLNGHILPFQVLSTRKRKDVDEATLKVQVCVYVFDLLYINGVSLIEQPLRIRRDILRNVLPSIEHEFVIAKSLDSSDTDEIASFLDEAIKGNCEGLMVKTLDQNSTYEIAKRSHSWLKLKKDYLDGIGDTLDLVVIGGFHGTGKRAGRYGGYLLACYDPEVEEYQSICKIGTGIKDEELASFSNFFKDHVIESARSYYQFTPSLIPDHWFEPVAVWEIKAADLSISPAHKAAAGMADPNKGISLRFPRFVRVRDDKKPEEATTAEQVYSMYKNQEQIKNQSTNQSDPNNNNNDDDDLY